MEVTLGHSLDSAAYAPLPVNEARAGHVTAGPTRFLEILETMYGLPIIEYSGFTRTLQYEKLLREADDGSMFYSGSFAQDSYGVATKLLGQRDEILLWAGSDFSLQSLSRSSRKIVAFAKCEEGDRGAEFFPGIPDRIRTVIAEMKKKRIPCVVTSLKLTEQKSLWPVLWREMFRFLEEAGCNIETVHYSPVESAGDLGIAKESLFNENDTSGKNAAGDDSLLLITAANPVEAGDVTALLIKQLTEKNESVAVIAGSEEDFLDNAMKRFDLPTMGSKVDSYGLDVLQVLPLRFALAWQPADPFILQQYLSLSFSPLPTILRKELQELVSTTGSTGGSSFDEAIRGFLNSCKKEKQPEIKSSIEKWLSIGTLAKGSDMPAEKVLELCRAFRTWAHSRYLASGTKDWFLARAKQQAELLIEAHTIRGSKSFSRRELRKLLRDITGSVPVYSKTEFQKGAPYSVSSPGNILAPADTVIWWNAGEQSLDPLPERFGTGPKKELSEHGVALPEASQLLERHYLEWKRAIGLTTKRLIFIYPDVHRNEKQPDEVHPVWHELAFGFTEESRHNLVIPVSALFTENRKTGLAGKLAECPMAYTLYYLADVHSEDIISVSDGALLYGIVSHAVIEEYLISCENKWPEKEKVRKTVTRMYGDFLAKKAAVLNLPGKDKERADLLEHIVTSCEQLVIILRAGDYVLSGVEKEYTVDTGLGPVMAFCDLVLAKRSDPESRAIIDLKWSRRDARKQELVDGLAIQLAVYSSLFSDRWPPTGYFIITSAELLTVHGDAFPGVRPVDGPDEKSVWGTVRPVIQSELKKLSSGTAFLGIEDGDKENTPDLLYAPCKYCEYSMFCRRRNGS
jgi:hypothetical protein